MHFSILSKFNLLFFSILFDTPPNSESTEEFNIQLANSTPVIETNLTTASQKELITYDERLLKMAIQQLFSTYEENGMIGLVSDIQECYEQNENIKYCFYLDYSTRIFEFHMSESMNTSPYEFLMMRHSTQEYLRIITLKFR